MRLPDVAALATALFLAVRMGQPVLLVLQVPVLDRAAAGDTLAAVVKHDEDLARVRAALAEVVGDA